MRRIAVSFGLFFGLAAGTTLVEALLTPGRFRLTFDPAQWLLTLPIIVLVATLQTSAEEVLFRGCLLQTVGLFTRRGWLLVAVNHPNSSLPTRAVCR